MLLIVFAVAMLILVCVSTDQAHAEKFWFNQTIKELLHDYDSEADRRGDAADNVQNYERTVPLYSNEGLEGWAVQNPNGSIYLDSYDQMDLDSQQILDGGHYDY